MVVSLFSAASARSLLSLRGGTIALESEDQKSLYSLGCNVGRQIGDLDCFSHEEIDIILFGMRDTLTRVEPRVNLMEYMPKVAALFKARQDAHIKKVEEASKEALEAAAKEDGAVVTASGLVIKTLQEGEGDSPTIDSTVRVHYTGRLSDGTVFDSSIPRGEPTEFPLSGVVKGWQEGIALMKPGGKAKLTLPAELGYGDEGQSTIPPKATLIFEVELLAIVN